MSTQTSLDALIADAVARDRAAAAANGARIRANEAQAIAETIRAFGGEIGREIPDAAQVALQLSLSAKRNRHGYFHGIATAVDGDVRYLVQRDRDFDWEISATGPVEDQWVARDGNLLDTLLLAMVETRDYLEANMPRSERAS